MNCREFLDRHSEYVDGVIDAAGAARLAAHARTCASCGRYDRVVRRGGQLVREVLPRVGVSGDFAARVQHRLFHERDAMRRRRAGSVPVYAVAASVVLLLAGAGAFALVIERTPVVDAQIVWATAPHAFTPLESHAFVAPSAPLSPTRKEAAPVSAIEAETLGHDAHPASPTAWPVYSRGDAARAFPPSSAELLVKPAEFRAAPAVYTAGPILVRH